MVTPAMTEEALRNLNEIQGFIKERFDNVTGEVKLLKEEQDRLAAAVKGVQESLRAKERERALKASEHGAELVVPSGPYAGRDILDMALLRKFARSQSKEANGPAWVARAEEAMKLLVAQVNAPQVVEALFESAERKLAARFAGGTSHEQFQRSMRPWLQDFYGMAMAAIGARGAMDSTTAGFGDELVATLEARTLWMDVNLATLVAPLVPVFPMPSNPFDIPRQLGDVNFYPGAENIATTSTRLGTGKATLTAYELVGQVPYSFTLEEDAIISLLPEIRAGLVRNTAEVIDDVILNADTTVTNNINADGATIAASDAGKGHWLLGYDGLVHLPLVDNTAQANNHNAAVSDDMFNEIRAKLGRYGVRPSEVVWVMDVNTFIRAQSIANFRTMDKLGPNATILTGMLGAVEGIPVIVSEQMRLADADGKVTDGGNAVDTGRLLIFNRTQWAQGFRRDMTIDVDRDTQKRQTVVTVSFRHALTERSGSRSTATHTALQYNITGI